jgi:hypothetical protein
MVTRQPDMLKELLLHLLVMATPVKFALWSSSGLRSVMVGWGPVHLMPARTMRPSPPRMYRLHSVAPAPVAFGVAAVALAAAELLPSGCA